MQDRFVSLDSDYVLFTGSIYVYYEETDYFGVAVLHMLPAPCIPSAVRNPLEHVYKDAGSDYDLFMFIWLSLP